MIKLFERIFWHNDTTPAINEDNLNAMSKAIDDIDDRVIELAADVLEVVPQIEHYLEQAEDLYEAMENLSKHPPYIGANGDWYVWDTVTSDFVDSGIDASITVQIADVTMLAYGAAPYITNSGTSTDPVFHLFIPRAAGITSITKTGTSGLVDTYTITFQDGNTTTFTVTNGKSIVSIAKTATSGLVDTYTITFNDSTTTTFQITNGKNGEDGQDGDDGRGIVSIQKTATVGLVDTYTITYTDGTTSTFDVTNGQNGSGSGDMMASTYDPNGTVASAGGIPSYVTSAISGKQDKLTFDNSPTSGSNNPVKSDGIYANTVNAVAAGTAQTNGQVRMSVTKGATPTNVDASVAGWNALVGKWTAAVTALTGATSVTLANPFNTASVDIDPYCENQSGTSIPVLTHTATTSTITLTFDALEEDTSFKAIVRSSV